MLDMIVGAERKRAVDVEFLVERYHRAFDEELAVVRRLLTWRRGSGDGCDELISALTTLDACVEAHARFQERRLFPAFTAGAACSAAWIEAWSMDALRLFGVVEVTQRACRDCGAESSLVARIAHLAQEIEDHLAAEARVIAPWAGLELP